MATGGIQPPGDPPDKNENKVYKYHPKQKVAFVICIVCEDVYYKSDYSKCKDKRYISDVFMICPNHVEMNITLKDSKINLNETARMLIANIKSTKEEQIKQQILNEISSTENSRKSEDKEILNTTVISENTELENLQTENKLLKELNKEISDKNTILKEFLEKLKTEKVNDVEIKQHNQKTYAEVITTKPPIKTKRVPTITVKNLKKDPKSYKDFSKKVCNCLIEEKDIQIKQVKKVNDTDIEIKSMNERSALATAELLNRKLSNNYKITIESIEMPKMKIVGIDNYAKLKSEELEKDINIRNFNEYHEKCKILHINQKDNSAIISIIIEVPREIYKHIINNKNRIFVGFQCCKVWDLINVKPCNNCGRFGHSTAKCKNEICCLKCAGKHLTIQCNDTSENTCINCFYSNTKYKTSLEVNHMANDTERCAILKNKLNRYIDMTDYPIRPTLPRYIGGKVGNRNNSTAPKVSYLSNVLRKLTTSATTSSPLPHHSSSPQLSPQPTV